MDAEELIDSLHRDAEVKIGAIWAESETAAVRLEDDRAAAANAARSTCLQETAGDVERKTQSILARAAQEAARLRHSAEQSLSARLFPLALASLHPLAGGEEGDLFGCLARELPPLTWKQLRVNPRDASRARELFPHAVIVTDDGISGGLEAATGDGGMRVVNTIEKRLENAWEEMLPGLIGRCYGALQDS